MGRIQNTNKYAFDTIVTNEDYIIGTDAEGGKSTKSFKVEDLIAFMSTQIDGTTQDNIFVEIDLGSMNEGESVSELANNLPEYTVTESSLAIYKVDINSTTSGGEDRVAFYLTLLRGKGTYGVGGTALTDSNFLNINPVQLETIRNSVVIENLIQSNRVFSGNVNWSGGGLVFEATPHVYSISGIIYNAPANLSITLDTGDSDPRIDLIAVNTSGNYVVIKGTPAPSPSAPTLQDFNTQIALTTVDVAALATEPTGITSVTLYDENLGTPIEWTPTENTGASRIVTNSTDDPFQGTVSIKGMGLLTGDKFTLTNDSQVPVASMSYMSFTIKLDNNWSRSARLKIRAYDGLTLASQDVNILQGAYGFIRNNTGVFQTIIIPMYEFSFSQANVDSFEFEFTNPNTGDINYIDNIRIVSGAEVPTPVELPEKTSDLENDGADGTSTYVETDELGATAFDNDYNSLDNLPSIPNQTSDITNNGADGASTYVETDELGAVAFSNDYDDLSNKPTPQTIPTDTSDLVNDGADGTSTYVETDELGAVAFSNDYDDLSNRPVYFGYAASDELSDLEVQENAIRFRMPFSMTLTDVIATVNEGCFGSKIICDVEQEGVSIFSTLLTIDQEGRATGTVELTGGASGSVDGITVDGVEIMSGAEAFDTDLGTTAANVAANITAHTSSPDYTASAVGSVITITSVFAGSDINGYAVVSTATTITTTDANLSGGTSSETSNVASVPAVISNPNLTEDMEISANIDQVGSTQAGKGLKIWFIGTKV